MRSILLQYNVQCALLLNSDWNEDKHKIIRIKIYNFTHCGLIMTFLIIVKHP